MKNYIYFSITLIIFLMSCSSKDNQNKITLKTTGFTDSTKIYLHNYANETIDSGYIVNNFLVFSVNVDEPTQFMIRPVIKTRADIDVRSFWKEGNQVTIQAEKGNIKNAVVEGSEIQKQADILRLSKINLEQSRDSLQNQYWSLPEEDTEKRLSLRTEKEKIEQAITDTDVNYIKENPDEFYSVITLRNLMKYTIPKALTKELFESLSAENQSTKYGIMVRKFLELSTDFKIGDKAANFELQDLNGNLIGLNSFKNKYILLDFWSSNCGPCLIDNPILLKNYKTYRDRGFEIVGISLDKNRDDWEKSVKRDSMIWPTVSDLKGFDGDLPITYNVYFIPTYYLIDPNGIIIDKIMGRGQLDEKLKAIFKN